MKLKSLFASMFAVFALTSCEDMFEDSTKPDGSKPHITVNAPTANHSFTQANGVTLNLTAVDKDHVQDLNVQIKSMNGETLVTNFTKHFTKTVAVVDTVVAANQIAPGKYRMLITAKDKRSNVESKEIIFTVN